jgi:urease accessory protein
MHMTVVQVSEAFEPESGAYGDHGGHSHGGHNHGHAHSHNDQATPTEPHVHGPGCNHAH